MRGSGLEGPAPTAAVCPFVGADVTKNPESRSRALDSSTRPSLERFCGAAIGPTKKWQGPSQSADGHGASQLRTDALFLSLNFEISPSMPIDPISCEKLPR